MIIIESDIFGDGNWGKLSSLPDINERMLLKEGDRQHLDREAAIDAARREIGRWRAVILDAYPAIRMRVADTDAGRRIAAMSEAA